MRVRCRGKVQIRATVGGTTTVVYDSGEVDLAPFAGQTLLAIALDTVNPTAQATSPVKLLVATDSAFLSLYDTGTNAGARVVHGSPDADGAVGDVEVWATSDNLNMGVPPSSSLRSPIATSCRAPTRTSQCRPGTMSSTSIRMAPAGCLLHFADITLDAAWEFSVIAAGNVAGGPDFGLLLSVDDSRSVATQASVKVIHAVPNAVVDVYVTPAGEFDVTDVETGVPVIRCSRASSLAPSPTTWRWRPVRTTCASSPVAPR